MSYRSNKQTKAYDKHLSKAKNNSNKCDFCAIDRSHKQFVSETSSFMVVHNIFPYSLWDNQPVLDHLMLIPKQHTDTLADITPEAASEFVRTISKYEQKGYDIYARAPGSVMKSVTHQHTHLIKLARRKVRGLIYFEKPHLRIVIK
ncbi:MAG: HIT domain-containing protein [Patescibacteria group bacterium]